MATKTHPGDRRAAREKARQRSPLHVAYPLPPGAPENKRDIRPRAGEHEEIQKRDKWMAWGFILLALIGAMLLFAFCGRAVP